MTRFNRDGTGSRQLLPTTSPTTKAYAALEGFSVGCRTLASDTAKPPDLPAGTSGFALAAAIAASYLSGTVLPSDLKSAGCLRRSS
jgi:hypothetical protein